MTFRNSSFFTATDEEKKLQDAQRKLALKVQADAVPKDDKLARIAALLDEVEDAIEAGDMPMMQERVRELKELSDAT